MEAVTNSEGQKGFYDKSVGFINVDDMQKVTNAEGQRGYYHEASGFVPVPQDVTQQPLVAQDKGFWDRMAERKAKRTSSEAMADTVSSDKNPNSILTSINKIGNAAGYYGTDYPLQAIESAYKTVVPETAQKVISSGANKLMNMQMDNLPEGDTNKRTLQNAVNNAEQLYMKTREAQPDLVKSAEAFTNMIPAYGLGKGIVKGTVGLTNGVVKYGSEGINIAKDLKAMTKMEGMPATPEAKLILEQTQKEQVKQIAEDNLSKSIKSSVPGSWNLLEGYFDKGSDGIIEIVKNKKNLGLKNSVGTVDDTLLPQNRLQMLKSIDATKDNLVREYTKMATNSSGKGSKLNLLERGTLQEGVIPEEGLLDVIDTVIKDPVLQTDSYGQKVIRHAEKQKKLFENRKEFTPIEAQRWITNANQRLRTFYEKGGSVTEESNLAFDAGIASVMRKKLDSLIQSTEGVGYQNLKNKYGSVASLEEGTAKAAFASSKEINLPNFFDITSGAALTHGIINLSPSTIIPSVFMESMNFIRRKLRDPDMYIKRMFNETESVINPSYKSKWLKGREPK